MKISGLSTGFLLVARLADALKVLVIIRSALGLRDDVVTHAMVWAVECYQLRYAVGLADLALETVTLEDLLPQPAPARTTAALAPSLLGDLVLTRCRPGGSVGPGLGGHYSQRRISAITSQFHRPISPPLPTQLTLAVYVCL